MDGKSLYALGSELAFLEKLTEEPDQDQEQIAISQTELVEMVKSKVDSVCGFYHWKSDRIEAIDNRIKELRALKESEEKAIERLDGYIKTCFEVLDTKVLNGKTSTLKIQNNPPSVNILNENEIPLEFITTKVVETVTIEKRMISAALKAGKEIPGALLQQKSRIVIC